MRLTKSKSTIISSNNKLNKNETIKLDNLICVTTYNSFGLSDSIELNNFNEITHICINLARLYRYNKNDYNDLRKNLDKFIDENVIKKNKFGQSNDEITIKVKKDRIYAYIYFLISKTLLSNHKRDYQIIM